MQATATAETTGERLYRMAEDVAVAAHLAYSRDIYTLQYAFYRPSGPGRWGQLIMDSDHPEGDGWLLLAIPSGGENHIPRHRTIEQNTRTIRDLLQRLPLLPQ